MSVRVSSDSLCYSPLPALITGEPTTLIHGGNVLQGKCAHVRLFCARYK